MAFSGSSIAILFIGAAVYAAAGPVQLHGGSSTVQRDDYGSPALAELLARYWEDRRTHQNAKRNLDQIGGGHLVRNTDEQLRRLLDEKKDRSSQNVNSADDRQILDVIGRDGFFIDRFRDANILNSAINSGAIIDAINRLYGLDSNVDQAFTNQLTDGDVWKNAREGDRRIVKNLDQIGGGHLVRNLDQIGGGHLVRNLDQIGGGHLVRNLDQIGGGHLVRNLDQIGGGHLVRNLDQIGGGNLVRSPDYSNVKTKQRIDQPAGGFEKLHFSRNLDQIGGGNLLRNLDQIGGGNLLRNLDQIGGGNLLRNLDQIGGGNLVRSLDDFAMLDQNGSKGIYAKQEKKI
nr:PREDICTED: uncharacterized protein LOC105673964 isoform X1 [Linepithema humile]